MKVLYKKTFLKDVESFPSDAHKIICREAFEIIPALSSVREHEDIRKLSGHEKFYRIRVGQFRTGIELRGDIIVFYRVPHRKDISIFPADAGICSFCLHFWI